MRETDGEDASASEIGRWRERGVTVGVALGALVILRAAKDLIRRPGIGDGPPDEILRCAQDDEGAESHPHRDPPLPPSSNFRRTSILPVRLPHATTPGPLR